MESISEHCLRELRRQHIALAEAQSAVGKAGAALGERVCNEILARLDSAQREVMDKIDITEGRC